MHLENTPVMSANTPRLPQSSGGFPLSLDQHLQPRARSASAVVRLFGSPNRETQKLRDLYCDLERD